MPATEKHIARWVLAAAVLSFIFQLTWFGSRCFHQIDIDGIDYIGVARHLRSHQFYAAIDGLRSPLISWMIAAGSFLDGDLARVGKILNIVSYLLCGTLLYFFTKSLWHSELAASLAVLWFSLCRGLSLQAVAMVTPDFLFAALTLIYFMFLLRCFRVEENGGWVWLGAVHALAFLAKAFALPWLALITTVSALLSRPRKQWAVHLALAGILPLLVAAAWAGVLHLKYGEFTTGTQSKFNLVTRTLHASSDRPNTYAVLNDTRPFVDEFGVYEPGSWILNYRIDARQVAPVVAKQVIENIPRAVKELLIVVTPGGPLAFIFVLAVLFRRREQYRVEFRMAAIAGLAIVSLLLAYCVIAIENRYLFPITTLLLAVAVGFFIEQTGPVPRLWHCRRAVAVLIVLGILASFVYPSSPFRTITRDFQISCYQAGKSLRAHPGSTVVSIGLGPYPDHGVGWEAGYKSAYFGDRRMIAATEKLPAVEEIPAVLGDLAKARPDSILIWGKPGDAHYETLVQRVSQSFGGVSNRISLTDPYYGEVGSAFFMPQS